jgi:bifunctional DNase/RNase
MSRCGSPRTSGLATEEEQFQCVVLEEVAGDRQLPIEIGWAEAFSLAARLDGITWPRPMTYQFVAALVEALGGRVRRVRIDRVVEKTYVATVEVDGPPGVQSVDARPSDALNLAARLRRALAACPMTVGTVRNLHCLATRCARY